MANKKAAPKKSAQPSRAAAMSPLETPMAQSVPVDAITPHPQNPRAFARKDKDDAALRELAQSIKEQGLLSPITVRPLEGGGFQLVFGERRWRAAKLAGYTEIPAFVRNLSDGEALEDLVTENLQREDLSPLEEATGVKALLEQAGWSIKDVGDRIGRSAAWVAQRARLADLSPTWRKALMDPESPVSGWPIGLLVEVAKLEPQAQDLIAQREGWLDEGQWIPERREVTHAISAMLRNVDRAPWKKDDEALYPEAGACAACRKRASCHPGLFEDEGDAIEGDRCLDATCWAEKERRHLEARKAALQEKHPNLILVHGEHSPDSPETAVEGAVNYYSTAASKKGEPGALPALVVDGKGAGSLRWVQVMGAGGRSPAVRPKDASGNTIPKPLSERRVALERRRVVKAVELVKKGLGDIVPFPSPPHVTSPLSEILVPLVATFGTAHKRDSSQYEPIHDDEKRRATHRKPGESWRDAQGLANDPEAQSVAIWRQVLPVLLSRLAYQGTPTDTKKLEADAAALCGFLGLNYDAAKAEAVAAIPEPKAWASLNEDGTTKPTLRAVPSPAQPTDADGDDTTHEKAQQAG